MYLIMIWAKMQRLDHELEDNYRLKNCKLFCARSIFRLCKSIILFMFNLAIAFAFVLHVEYQHDAIFADFVDTED